jgi:hypothetical protein
MAVVYDEYVRLMKETEGQVYIAGVVEKSGAVRRTCLQEYANLLQLHKHNAACLDIYRRIANENPKDISAWMGLADELDYNSQRDDANQVYVDQIARTDLKPTDLFSLRYKLATRYFQQSKLQQARALFQVIFERQGHRTRPFPFTRTCFPCNSDRCL